MNSRTGGYYHQHDIFVYGLILVEEESITMKWLHQKKVRFSRR
jgi:hypothetical protein